VSRWPYAFSLDDLDIQGCIYDAPLDGPLLDAGDRVPGIYVKHRPTGREAIMTAYATRDENLQAALRRLDRVMRRDAG
jgi:hypothetical protein